MSASQARLKVFYERVTTILAGLASNPAAVEGMDWRERAFKDAIYLAALIGKMEEKTSEELTKRASDY